jgi:hypothetical protein
MPSMRHAPRVMTLSTRRGASRRRSPSASRSMPACPCVGTVVPAWRTQLLAKEVHHIGTVGLVAHGEVGAQTERASVEAEQPLATAWNVPPQTRSVSRLAGSAVGSRSISRAARRLNVSSRIRSGHTPRSTRWPTRQAGWWSCRSRRRRDRQWSSPTARRTAAPVRSSNMCSKPTSPDARSTT